MDITSELARRHFQMATAIAWIVTVLTACDVATTIAGVERCAQRIVTGITSFYVYNSIGAFKVVVDGHIANKIQGFGHHIGGHDRFVNLNTRSYGYFQFLDFTVVHHFLKRIHSIAVNWESQVPGTLNAVVCFRDVRIVSSNGLFQVLTISIPGVTGNDKLLGIISVERKQRCRSNHKFRVGREREINHTFSYGKAGNVGCIELGPFDAIFIIDF